MAARVENAYPVNEWWKNPVGPFEERMAKYNSEIQLDDQLVIAIENHDMDEIRRLAEAGANVNRPDVLRKTPMHVAAIRGDVDALRILKEFGGDPTAKAMGGKTPLDWARVDNRGTPKLDKRGSVVLLESW
eukprot:CAMPEP_0119313030 /NCGR_PEP_ID=MMETSP1333-20130426/27609_1 /TAXON_ID=418940 /ORGANISM="Scyphosphaera apsteinii, Strain RCC1455" /LENGTH=130 /DNA_ID=CAMNT_0007317751 /DNA_START=26 /DNA_END=415 /DNA_ORIENTATION=-